jgi:DNA-binding response OmpR family regulator
MRILAVDDEPRISADISAALTAAGYLADIASDGEHAWFRGDTEAYDLVILDLGLPKMDGLSVLRRWREAERHMPVLILTARGAWPERVEGIDAGADDYLAKPFRMEELIARVRALIRRSTGQGAPVIEAGVAAGLLLATLIGIPVGLFLLLTLLLLLAPGLVAAAYSIGLWLKDRL